MLQDFISLIFPESCVCCSKILQKGEKEICTFCIASLPVISDKNVLTNLEKRFWGKIHIENTFAYLKFTKLGIVQKILFAIKYKGRKEVGWLAGKWFGESLKEQGYEQYFDLIIPVPLHKKRLRQRGYNQSDLIADSVSKSINTPVYKDVMVRTVHKETQTRKGRMERWLETEGIYKIVRPEVVEGKHILIIDDVVTTGSTLEAIAAELLKHNATAVSIGALAVAQ